MIPKFVVKDVNKNFLTEDLNWTDNPEKAGVFSKADATEHWEKILDAVEYVEITGSAMWRF